MKDFIYRILGYKWKYSDMEGKALYLKGANNKLESINNKLKVRQKFGHLKYIFKTRLSTGNVKKVSVYYFINI